MVNPDYPLPLILLAVVPSGSVPGYEHDLTVHAALCVLLLLLLQSAVTMPRPVEPQTPTVLNPSGD
jgi:hypothetical protein